MKDAFSDISSISSDDRTPKVKFAEIKCQLIPSLNCSERDPCFAIANINKLFGTWQVYTTEDWKGEEGCLFKNHACQICLIIGLILSDGFLYEKSLPLLRKAEEASRIFYKDGEMKGIMADFFKNLYIALAQVLSHNRGKIEETLSYIKKARDLIKRFPDKDMEKTADVLRVSSTKDVKDIFILILTKGDVHLHDGQYEKAERYYLKGLKYIMQNEELYLLFLAYSRLVLVCMKLKKDYLDYFKKMEDCWKTIVDHDYLWKNTYLEGIYYFVRSVVLCTNRHYPESRKSYRESVNVLAQRLPDKNWLQAFHHKEYKMLTKDIEYFKNEKVSDSLFETGDYMKEMKVREVEDNQILKDLY